MKTLTQNFRKYFENFDFNNQNYNTLHALLDIILEMMSITEYEGKQIKVLSSFVRMLSSDFCQDVIDLEFLKNIFEVRIIPILEYFDNKYANTKSLEESMTQVAEKMMDEEGISINKEDASRYFNTEIGKLCEDISNDITTDLKINELYPNSLAANNGNDTNDPSQNKVVMELLSATQQEVYLIYNDYIIENKHYDKRNVLAHLHEVYQSTAITSQHENQQIRSISMALCGICNTLITIIETGGVPIEVMKQSIEMSFKFIDNVKCLDG